VIAGQAMADAVGDIFGIDSTLLFEAEIDWEEARITRGVHGTDGRIVVFRDADGEVKPVQVLEVFSMRTPL
jgi:hypothetical protein